MTIRHDEALAEPLSPHAADLPTPAPADTGGGASSGGAASGRSEPGAGVDARSEAASADAAGHAVRRVTAGSALSATGSAPLSTADPSPFRYSEVEIAAVWRAIRERRDMRHFLPDPLPAGVLERLIEAAHLAPSVGYMQPWRFLRITDGDLRRRIHDLVVAEKEATRAALPSRRDEFVSVKIEGVLDCAEVLVVSLMDGRERHLIGRRTLPDMDLASVACAIQNMWLVARAEGIGLGWVSFFDPLALAELLALPDGALPVAVLCIGRVPAFYPRPMFEDAGWGERLPLSQVLFENRWPADAEPTLPAY
jgi:5,6-dimethylbenzimidazole synthase